MIYFLFLNACILIMSIYLLLILNISQSHIQLVVDNPLALDKMDF